MTIQQIAQRLKQAQGGTDLVRQILSDAGVKEHTVYSPPTQKWQTILNDLGLSELANRTVCATCYGTDESVFEAVGNQLKKRYKVVVNSTVDELGFRMLFICAQAADKEPALVVAVNYYEGSREETKAMYSNSTDAGDNSDTQEPADIELENSDPFA